ncbi:EthD family reductase [Actinoplanes sp. NPDC051851]|uniref:EthD family reductase n=1 Tax=Actinoplanes sp. NPDC051851 TaxID=3154753 RepID=UPI003441C60E
MIHQLILAGPRPGMTVPDFQHYWRDVHAVEYAAKIPQIRRYLVDDVEPMGPEETRPPWRGAAEIWLTGEREQVASLQTPEFLRARQDEPTWAAFWQTIVLDTDAHEVVPGPDGGVKLILLVKRAPGSGLAAFRERGLGAHATLTGRVPGLRRYLQGYTRDGAYQLGEAVLDGAHQLWFEDADALTRALASPEFARAEEDLRDFADPRYLHRLVAIEHWIIGPHGR